MPTSSANRQKSRRIRKCAVACGSLPYRRQELRQPGELARGFLGHLAGGQTGAQLVRVGESLAEKIQLVGDQQVIQRQLEDPLDRIGEIGVDDDALQVGDDQQRWVQQRLAVLQKLAIGLVQIGVLSLVFPGEAAHLPDVGETSPHPRPLSRCGGRGETLGAGFEGVPAAGGIGLGRRRLAQQRAQVVEVRLASRALLERGVPPLDDELLR